MGVLPSSDHAVNFLFVEHATPAFPGGKRCLLGNSDVPLSEEGEREAKDLKKALEKSGIVFHAVFSSDLERASKTAEILAKDTGVDVQKESIFRETNKGDLQGLTSEEYRKKASYEEYKHSPNPFFAYMGKGESVESKADLANRLIPWMNEIRQDSFWHGKTILIVTHGNPLKVVDTLSRNPGSLNPGASLEEELKDIPQYAEPKSCAIYWFTGNSQSFERKGTINIEQDGQIDVGPSLLERTVTKQL